MASRILNPHFLFSACLLAVVLIYLPGLNGGYNFDDAHVLVDNPYVKVRNLSPDSLIPAAESFVPGGRQLSMVSFAINYYLFGDSTWWFKFINLVIHCLNGLGIYILGIQLVSRSQIQSDQHTANEHHRLLPLIVAGLWLVQPINLIPVLYISQRMVLLSGFFTIYGLVCYLALRTRIHSVSRQLLYMPLVIAGFTAAGYLCKENAILIPVYVLMLELLVLKFVIAGKVNRQYLGVFVAGIAVALILVLYYFWQHPNWIASGYRTRFYTLEERVLTQFRVLVYYLWQIVLPSNLELSLWHDDFSLSSGLFKPFSTFACFLLLIFLAGIGFFMRNRAPLVAVGIFWFFISHGIESTVFSLELIHEHRNYLASFGVMLALSVAVMHLLSKIENVALILFAGYFLLNGIVLHQRSQIWADDTVRAQHEALSHPESGAAVFEYGQKFYVAAMNGSEESIEPALRLIDQAARNDKYSATPELLLVVFSEHEKVEYQSQWLIQAGQKISAFPHMAPTKSAVQKFYYCLRDGVCNAPRTDTDRFFEILAASPDSNLNSTAAFYFTNVGQDMQRAKSAFKKGLRNRNLQTWINYLSFLNHTGDLKTGCNVYERFLQKRGKGNYDNLVLFHRELQFLDEAYQACETG